MRPIICTVGVVLTLGGPATGQCVIFSIDEDFEGDLGRGASVAVHGDVAVIGSLDLNGQWSSVDVHGRRPDGTWALRQQIMPDVIDPAADFGAAVAVTDGLLLVGAPQHEIDGVNAGAAFVFREDGDGTWSQVARLEAPTPEADANFGSTVACLDGIALVGSFAADTAAGVNSGAVFAFAEDPDTGAWGPPAVLLPAATMPQDFFGYDLDAAGDRLIAGTFLSDAAAANGGSATVFRLERGAWVEEQTLTAPTTAANDRYGIDVAIGSETAVIRSEPAADLHVFHRAGTAWTWEQSIDFNDMNRTPGAPVMDGERLIVTTIGLIAPIFERDAGGTWSRRGGLFSSEVYEEDRVIAADAGAALVAGRGLGQVVERAFFDYLGPDCGEGPEMCGADCNGNGISDTCDLNPADPDGDGVVSADCNGNGIPDECEPDCDANGIPDSCEIDPADPDGDGVVQPDCNANGRPDPCEVDDSAASVPAGVVDPYTSVLLSDRHLAIDGDELFTISEEFLIGTFMVFYRRDPDGIWRLNTRLPMPLILTTDVAMSGDIAVLSSFEAVLVLGRNDEGTWYVAQVLEDFPPATSIMSVAVHGSRIALGDADHFVFVYHQATPDGPWVQEQEIERAEFIPGFGTAVALNDDLLVIGGRDRVVTYERSKGTWTPAATIASPLPGVNFGHAMALDRDRLAVAFGDGAENFIRFYRLLACGSWYLEGSLEYTGVGDPDPNGGIPHLYDVDLEGDRCVVRTWAVRLFEFDAAEGAWLQRQQWGDDFFSGPNPVRVDRGRVVFPWLGEIVEMYQFAGDCNANGRPDACDLADGTSSDETGDGRPDECLEPCGADITRDRLVGHLDMEAVFDGWGCAGPPDVTGDGTVDVCDLVAVIEAWGGCPP